MGPDGGKGIQYQSEGAQVNQPAFGSLKMAGMELASYRGHLNDPGNLGWQKPAAQKPAK